MKIEQINIYNFQNALRGMRNPKNSWEKSDSIFDQNGYCISLGKNDQQLCQSLIKGGSEHRKFLRQIFVSIDITAPLYWWKEMDTYKVGTTANSTSTMHKITSSPIDLNKFEISDYEPILFNNENIISTYLIPYLEFLREKCIELEGTEEYKKYWKELIRWLPEGWTQTRTWTCNYENLFNIYRQRKNHKLIEWREFCKWIETLPYASELLIN